MKKALVPIWRTFYTKDALTQEIQNFLAPIALNVEFESQLISDLIAERHYYCSLKGLRPNKFEKRAGTNVYNFYGHFDGIGWHRVSWTKAITPPSKKDHIETALRGRIIAVKLNYRKKNSICEYCRKAPSEETHHESPEWRDILTALSKEITDEDIDYALSTWDWLKEEYFTISEDSKIISLFDSAHISATLKALCKKCHTATLKTIKSKTV